MADFMNFYRQTWPNESVTPKLHMLEDHVVDFVRRWKLGLGIYGEQGGESIHAEFNNLNTLFRHIPGRCSRLKSTMKEHYLRNHPVTKKMKPVIKPRRKRKNTE